MTSNNLQEPNINPVQQATSPGYKHHRLVPMLQVHEEKELTLPMVVLLGREASDVESKTYQDTLKAFNGKAPKNDEWVG